MFRFFLNFCNAFVIVFNGVLLALISADQFRTGFVRLMSVGSLPRAVVVSAR